jgi:hypothetical protein
MEFVTVTFGRPRTVNVDGAARGQIGQILRLQTGTHDFDLGSPPDYTPSHVLTPVSGTTLASPMVIPFTALTTGVPGPFAAAPPPQVPKATRATPTEASKAAARKRPKAKAAAKPAGKRKATARKAGARKTVR